MSRYSHGSYHRKPVNINLSSPVGDLNLKDYAGRTPPWVLMAAWMLTLGSLTVFLFMVSLGGVFGMFGLDGPSLFETLAIIVVLGTLGSLVRKG